MQTERVAYLSNFEEMVIQHGIGIQHVLGEADSPCFSYTVGLFEQEHPEFIVFGMPPQLARTILNDLAFQIQECGLRFGGNQRVHQLFQGAPAHLIEVHAPTNEYFGTAYAIRDRRYPELADYELDALHLVYQDPLDRWPWDSGSDYTTWPQLGADPLLDSTLDVIIPRVD